MAVLVFERNGRVDEGEGIFALAIHDLAEEHKLEGESCLFMRVHRSIAFERLVEIGVGSLVVFLVGSDEATHHVNLSLEHGHDVDSVGNSFDRSQSRLRLG